MTEPCPHPDCRHPHVHYHRTAPSASTVHKCTCGQCTGGAHTTGVTVPGLVVASPCYLPHPDAEAVVAPQQRQWPQMCKHGHDTHQCGRDSQGACRECRRQRRKKYRVEAS